MSADARLNQRLVELGWTLPAAPEPKGLYRPIAILEKLAYTAGHLPIRADGTLITGRLGEGLAVAAGQIAARWAALGILATLQRELGAIDRVGRLVKLIGFVNSTPDFTQQPAVINGCSELLSEVFGPDAGVGVRSAVGTNTLPLGAAVEIEAVFALK
ncbi:MAG: RidA family protein [Planctomycetota bacterium]